MLTRPDSRLGFYTGIGFAQAAHGRTEMTLLQLAPPAMLALLMLHWLGCWACWTFPRQIGKDKVM